MSYEKFALEDIEENAIYINRDYGGITKYNILTTDECLKEIGEKYNFVLENTVSIDNYNELRKKNKLLTEEIENNIRRIKELHDQVDEYSDNFFKLNNMSVKEFKEYKKHQ